MVLRSFLHHDEEGSTALHPRVGDGFVVPQRLKAPLGYPALSLRPLTYDDEMEWSDVRIANRDWLSPWDSGDPMHRNGISFRTWIDQQRFSEQSGSALVLAMEEQGGIVGQISLGGIGYGAVRSGIIGYWVAEQYAGRGFAPLSVALLTDWAFFADSGPHLHRVEIDILPENRRSLRVVQKLGFHDEGVRRGYMFVRGQWRDHRSFSLLSTDVSASLVERLPRL